MASYLAAAASALAVGPLIWFELLYLAYGITGEDPARAFNVASGLAAFGSAFGWPLYGAVRPAAVVRRGCRLGIVAAMLLPLVSIAVLLLWVNSPGRRDLGMGGLMLYNMPVVTFVAALVLVLLFGLCGRYAERRLRAAGHRLRGTP